MLGSWFSRAAWLNVGISTDYKLLLEEGGILKVAIIQCYVLERQIGLGGLVMGFFVASMHTILAATLLAAAGGHFSIALNQPPRRRNEAEFFKRLLPKIATLMACPTHSPKRTTW